MQQALTRHGQSFQGFDFTVQGFQHSQLELCCLRPMEYAWTNADVLCSSIETDLTRIFVPIGGKEDSYILTSTDCDLGLLCSMTSSRGPALGCDSLCLCLFPKVGNSSAMTMHAVLERKSGCGSLQVGRSTAMTTANILRHVS